MKHIKKTLQTLKSDITFKETLRKTIQKYYPHLSEYSQEELLAYFHLTTVDELKEFILNSLPASNKDDIDIHTTCTCTDAKGDMKELYESVELAQEQADVLMIHQKVNLKVYPCPYGYGWHLTKG